MQNFRDTWKVFASESLDPSIGTKFGTEPTKKIGAKLDPTGKTGHKRLVGTTDTFPKRTSETFLNRTGCRNCEFLSVRSKCRKFLAMRVLFYSTFRTLCAVTLIGQKFVKRHPWYLYRMFCSTRLRGLLTNFNRRLGSAAIFLIGGLSRDIDPVPIMLRSGDVIIMSGPNCRRAYHGGYPFF
jgi:hypothetical protein